MLLNILQCTGQPLTTKKYLAKMSIVSRLINPGTDDLLVTFRL